MLLLADTLEQAIYDTIIIIINFTTKSKMHFSNRTVQKVDDTYRLIILYLSVFDGDKIQGLL